ncbi:hypothetical protein WDX82_005129 [Salmonella enterica]
METESAKENSKKFIRVNRLRLRRLADLSCALHERRRGIPFPHGGIYGLLGLAVWFGTYKAGFSSTLFWISIVAYFVFVAFAARKFTWDDYLYRVLSKYEPADAQSFLSLSENIFRNGLNVELLEGWIDTERSCVRANLVSERAKYDALFKRSKQREKFIAKTLSYIDRLKQPSNGDR